MLLEALVVLIAIAVGWLYLQKGWTKGAESEWRVLKATSSVDDDGPVSQTPADANLLTTSKPSHPISSGKQWVSSKQEAVGTPAVDPIKRLEFPDTPYSRRAPVPPSYGYQAEYVPEGVPQRRPAPSETLQYDQANLLVGTPAKAPSPYVATPYPPQQQQLQQIVPYSYTPQPQPPPELTQPTSLHNPGVYGKSTSKKRPPTSSAMRDPSHLSFMSPEAEVYPDLVIMDPQSKRKRRRQGVYGLSDPILFPAARAYPSMIPPQYYMGYPDVFRPRRGYEEYVRGAVGGGPVFEYEWEGEPVSAKRPFRGRRQEMDLSEDGVDEEAEPAPAPTKRAYKTAPQRRRQVEFREAAEEEEGEEEPAPVTKRAYKGTPFRRQQAPVEDGADDEDVDVNVVVQEKMVSPPPRVTITPARSIEQQGVGCQTSPPLAPAPAPATPAAIPQKPRPVLKEKRVAERPPPPEPLTKSPATTATVPSALPAAGASLPIFSMPFTSPAPALAAVTATSGVPTSTVTTTTSAPLAFGIANFPAFTPAPAPVAATTATTSPAVKPVAAAPAPEAKTLPPVPAFDFTGGFSLSAPAPAAPPLPAPAPAPPAAVPTAPAPAPAVSDTKPSAATESKPIPAFPSFNFGTTAVSGAGSDAPNTASSSLVFGAFGAPLPQPIVTTSTTPATTSTAPVTTSSAPATSTAPAPASSAPSFGFPAFPGVSMPIPTPASSAAPAPAPPATSAAPAPPLFGSASLVFGQPIAAAASQPAAAPVVTTSAPAAAPPATAALFTSTFKPLEAPSTSAAAPTPAAASLFGNAFAPAAASGGTTTAPPFGSNAGSGTAISFQNPFAAPPASTPAPAPSTAAQPSFTGGLAMFGSAFGGAGSVSLPTPGTTTAPAPAPSPFGSATGGGFGGFNFGGGGTTTAPASIFGLPAPSASNNNAASNPFGMPTPAPSNNSAAPFGLPPLGTGNPPGGFSFTPSDLSAPAGFPLAPTAVDRTDSGFSVGKKSTPLVKKKK